MQALILSFWIFARHVQAGLISGSLCGGCTNSDQCFDFDPSTSGGPAGKYLGCFGLFTDGFNGLGTLCADGYTSVTVGDAVNLYGFTAGMCATVILETEPYVFHFAEGLNADLDNCLSDGATDTTVGLFACVDISRTTVWDADCVGGIYNCSGVTGDVCGVDESTNIWDLPSRTSGLTDSEGLKFDDASKGGAICIREETTAPSEVPSEIPSTDPTSIPTLEPSEVPSSVPTTEPSEVPTSEPSEFPSDYPTFMPSDPTFGPSFVPTSEPTVMPSDPTIVPSKQPSDMPTDTLPPTKIPSSEPSDLPSVSPSDVPTTQPSDEPTTYPSLGPTNQPTDEPTEMPTKPPIKVGEGGGTKEESGLIGSLSDELSILIIAGGACLLCILIAVIVVCMKKKQNEKATQGGNSTEMAGVAFKVHSDGATPNNSHYHEDKDEFHISNMTPK